MDHQRAVQRVLWITLLMNAVAMLAKLSVGLWTGTLSLIATGVDSVFDAASNGIGLLGVAVAERPADEEHPYGHRKAENLATLAIAVLLFVTTWELTRSGVGQLLDPERIAPQVTVWSFASLAISVVVQTAAFIYELRRGRALRSEILVADAKHSRADIFVSLSVIGGLAAVRLGLPIVDPLLALVIAAVIAKTGVDIIREASSALMDRSALPADRLEQIARSVPGVLSTHRARSRGQGDAVYGDLHIRVDPTLSTHQAHAIAHQVQDRVRERLPDLRDLTIHVEPASEQAAGRASDGGAEGEAATAHLRRIGEAMGLRLHDVWLFDLSGERQAEVHVEIDGALSLRAAHERVTRFERQAREETPGLATVITHIEPTGTLVEGTAGAAEAAETVDEAGVRAVTERALAEIAPDGGRCHDLRLRRLNDGWNVSLTCRLPGAVSITEAHGVSTLLETRLRRAIPALARVVIHMEPA
jgi:cation diffusion facilitator family transporter